MMGVGAGSIFRESSVLVILATFSIESLNVKHTVKSHVFGVVEYHVWS